MSVLSQLSGIPLRKLFLVTVGVKVLASIFAVVLHSPWILGFIIPLVFMATYVVLGFRRSPGDVSDERFGDSCYFLGFIFTISSIAASLFDIPDLDKAGRLTDIAVRFGAAMVSTIIGFMVRAYLVGFKNDSNEAMQSLEEQIVASANALKHRLDLSLQAFQDFEIKTRQAANDAEARVILATEGVGRHLSQEMSQALKAIAADVQAVHAATSEQMKVTGQSLVADLTKCSQALIAATDRAQAHFMGLTEKLDARLRSITFPDDYFTKELAGPLQNMVANVATVGGELKTLAAGINSSATRLSNAVEKIDGATQGSTQKLIQVLENIEIALDAPAKKLAAAMEKIEFAMEVPNSVRDLVNKQETVAKTVTEASLQSSQAMEHSTAAIKDQAAATSKLIAEISTTKAQLDELLSSARQVTRDLSGANLSKVESELRQLVALMEQLRSEPRPAPTTPPVATPAPIPSPRPPSPPPQPTAPPRPAAQPERPQPALSVITPDTTSRSFWAAIFGRNRR